MGEWSEYFEDFPEENPANWVNGQFNPGLRAQLNKEFAQQEEADLKVRQLITNAKRERKAKSFVATEDCPQCGLTELRTYKLSDTFYLCECQDCGIYGAGQTYKEALAKTADVVGDGLDWHDEELSWPSGIL